MEELRKISEYKYEVPMKKGMLVPGIIYADDRMMNSIKGGNSIEQVANVAMLPGIVKYSLAMPDIHWGYGFPIGGVAAFDFDDGIISPGGVGYDINCGVRLMSTDIFEISGEEKRALVSKMFTNVPSGVGSKSKLRLSKDELKTVLQQGARWAVDRGFGWDEDLERLEENGCMDEADPIHVSDKALNRGCPEIGTLGAGNHFLEIQKVDEIYDPAMAKKLGIKGKGQIMVLIHTGSRGFGHQVCTDWIEKMMHASRKYNITLPDKELVCAPLNSKEGEDYFKAMCCGANYGFANRQMITHKIRESFKDVLGYDEMHIVYGICHNIAKIEEHVVDGKRRKLCVHRKGATRAFPDQPVLIPGDMGRASYVLVGTETAMMETFGSTCHGAGRLLSRHAAIRKFNIADIKRELADKDIILKSASNRIIAEECPYAYKDVSDVVNICHQAGISRKIVKLVPIGVIKG